MPRFASGLSGKPAIILLVSFGALIGLGTILFSLPFATPNGGLPFAKALFMATSAVCVTGLSVLDVGSEMTLFGQWTLLALVQMGALGLMTFYALIFMMVGNAVPFIQRALVRETLSPIGLKGLNPTRLLRSVAVFTLIFEALGAVAFYFLFLREHASEIALKKAVFHSVSAFSNAGFSLQADSFVRWKGDIGINLVLIILILVGGLGFIVLTDFWNFLKNKFYMWMGSIRKVPIAEIMQYRQGLSLHTQIVLTATGGLVGFGFLVFWLDMMRGNGEGSWGSQALQAFFLSITARTAGFNTIPIEGISGGAAVLLIGLMYAGASPGSTGGGVKTTTVFVLLAALWSRIKGFESVEVFKKSVPEDIVRRAGVIFLLSIGILGAALFVLFFIEDGNPAFENMHRPFLAVLFEGVSAFATVGLSMGVTEHFSSPSLMVLAVLMFVGRIGPLTLFIALSERPKPRPRHPDELVMIG